MDDFWVWGRDMGVKGERGNGKIERKVYEMGVGTGCRNAELFMGLYCENVL